MLIKTQKQFDALVADLKAATDAGAPLAFDTEFLSEKRYFAKLCLVQVLAPLDATGAGANGEVVEGAIDPFGLNLTALAAMIADPDIVKIVHSGSADLLILWQMFEMRPENVFDTQIAAAFLGYGHQIGYADMVRRFTGAQISKTMQYTDWSARPLSAEQIEYAMDDVRYLPPIYADLTEQLQKRGRLEWAQFEFERAEAKATRPDDDENVYLRLNLSKLKRKQIAVLRELARVRQGLARAENKPPSFVVPDLALLQMARQQPDSVADLRAIRGMPGVPEKIGNRLLDAIDDALESDPKTWPPDREDNRPDPRLESIVALMNVVATARATSEEISRSYLAPRDAAGELAQWWLDRAAGQSVSDASELEIMQSWRGEILGRDLLKLLDGDAVIALDAATGLPQLRAS